MEMPDIGARRRIVRILLEEELTIPFVVQYVTLWYRNIILADYGMLEITRHDKSFIKNLLLYSGISLEKINNNESYRNKYMLEGKKYIDISQKKCTWYNFNILLHVLRDRKGLRFIASEFEPDLSYNAGIEEAKRRVGIAFLATIPEEKRAELRRTKQGKKLELTLWGWAN